MRYLFITFSIIFITSCSVKKRSYCKGYYIDWVHHKAHDHSSQEEIQPHAQAFKKTDLPHQEVVAIAEKKRELSDNVHDLSILSFKKQPFFNSDPCGDIITLKNSERINAKVIEINETEIHYKRCDNLNGPLYTINRSKVHSIAYTNGNIDLIEPEKAKPIFETTQNERKKITHKKAIWASAFSVFGLIVMLAFFGLALLATQWGISGIYLLLAICLLLLSVFMPVSALTLAKKASNAIVKQPDIYKGEDSIKSTKVLSWVVLSVSILMILLLLVLFFSL